MAFTADANDTATLTATMLVGFFYEFGSGSTLWHLSFRQTYSLRKSWDSKVIAGIHFRFACDAGQKMGDKVGKRTFNNYLKPLH